MKKVFFLAILSLFISGGPFFLHLPPVVLALSPTHPPTDDIDYQDPTQDLDPDGDGLIESEADCTDPLDPDSDGDGHNDATDNCPCDANAEQNDWNQNGWGDACDDLDYLPEPTTSPDPISSPTPAPLPFSDQDGDNIDDEQDNCPELNNADQLDTDQDALGDSCDDDFYFSTEDFDGDGVKDTEDNCHNVANASQADSDLDQVGDACDTDIPLQDLQRFSGFSESNTQCSLGRAGFPIRKYDLGMILLLLAPGLILLRCKDISSPQTLPRP